MRYLVIDSGLSGTGIRHKYPDWGEFSFVEPEDLGLSAELSAHMRDWCHRYWEEFYRDFKDPAAVESLDAEGIAITKLVWEELKGATVEYFSDAKLQTLLPPMRAAIDFSGMAVNERLYESGLSDEFYTAMQRGGKNRAAEILRRVEVGEDDIT